MNEKTIVACWGDSITEGMHMRNKSYPSKLQEMIGDNFEVYNGGDGGEKSIAIAARQGSIKVFTNKKITFQKDETTKLIATEKEDIFVAKNLCPIRFTSLLGNQISVNSVKIGDNEYNIRFEDFVWSPRTFKLFLDRLDNTDTELEIPSDSEVIFNGTDLSTKGGIDIYLMGANGGYNNDFEYIAQLKAMIKHHGNDKYIIVKPYWSWGNIEELDETFGEHILDFKKIAIEKDALAFEGLTKTEQDIKDIEANELPTSLRYQNQTGDVHLNEYGYDFLAHCVYDKGKELGYFK